MNKENVMQYFDNHLAVDAFYFTDDDQAFYTENEALNHAAGLRLKGYASDVILITREEVSEVRASAERVSTNEQAGDAPAGVVSNGDADRKRRGRKS